MPNSFPPSKSDSVPSVGDSSESTEIIDFNATNSIIEFLKNEKQCLVNGHTDDSEMDINSIFDEISRLSDNSDQRSVDEILREAEILLSKQERIEFDLGNGENDNDLPTWKFDERLDTISEESTNRENAFSKSDDSSVKHSSQESDKVIEINRYFQNSKSFIVICLKFKLI